MEPAADGLGKAETPAMGRDERMKLGLLNEKLAE